LTVALGTLDFSLLAPFNDWQSGICVALCRVGPCVGLGRGSSGSRLKGYLSMATAAEMTPRPITLSSSWLEDCSEEATTLYECHIPYVCVVSTLLSRLYPSVLVPAIGGSCPPYTGTHITATNMFTMQWGGCTLWTVIMCVGHTAPDSDCIAHRQ
jgi:hypothetical protein